MLAKIGHMIHHHPSGQNRRKSCL